MVKEANQWIQNNIGRHGQKDQFKGTRGHFFELMSSHLQNREQIWTRFKARRLVERYNELPDRYMQVIGRCRDPGSLGELEELRRSRPIRQERKVEVKLERSLAREKQNEEKEAKM